MNLDVIDEPQGENDKVIEMVTFYLRRNNY